MVIKLTLKKPSGALPKKSCKHVELYTEVEENDFSPTKAVKSFKDADFTEKIVGRMRNCNMNKQVAKIWRKDVNISIFVSTSKWITKVGLPIFSYWMLILLVCALCICYQRTLFVATDSLYAFMPRRLSIWEWNIGTSILPIFWQRELKITELYFYDSAIVETVNVDATRCDIL